MYSYDEVMTYAEEEDVKFVKLAFCDIKGRMKNISIMTPELKKAFDRGIEFDPSAVEGFEGRSDLLLHPDPSTLTILPWRPSHGRVVRMLCNIKYPDGSEFELDGREILRRAEKKAREHGVTCLFGAEIEFYLFKTDENGDATRIPFDNAGYMDIAPYDKGENVRREICFSLEQMGFRPESSHHEVGPGQNEIVFRGSEPLDAADNAITFKSVVKTISARNGLFAEFSPKPLSDHPGNGFHINITVRCDDGKDRTDSFAAGILRRLREITAFLNPRPESYERMAGRRADVSDRSRSCALRLPCGDERKIEIRTPDSMLDPYIAYALLIYAGLEGLEGEMTLPEKPADAELLPTTLPEAAEIAGKSDFVAACLPADFIEKI